MIDIKQIRSDLDGVVSKLNKKKFKFDSELFLSIDRRRKELQIKAESNRAQRNTYSKNISSLIHQAKAEGKDFENLVKQGENLKKETQEVEDMLEQTQRRLEQLVNEVPNLPDASVPEGSTESSNIELTQWGEIPSFDFTPRDHVDLGIGVGGLDIDRAAKITGSRFSIIKGNLALLHRALSQFMLTTHVVDHGYEEIYVPYIVNSQSLFGTGNLPKFADDLFKLDDDRDFYLIPTAEVPVTNFYRNEIINDLPKKFVCHTPCFRSEAGSYGRDTRGMIRQHQFDKVELMQFVEPEKSWDALEELTENAESILHKLELPFRRMALCGGDLGFSSAKTYDLEVWLPSQKTFREISSCSNFTDFQARRMKTRYRSISTNRPELIHTINGSGLAVGRTLVAVLENNQQNDGSILVPDVLRPYMNGMTKLEPLRN